MQSFSVTIPPTKVDPAGMTRVVMGAADKRAAADIALKAHREFLGVPGFTAIPTVREVTFHVGDSIG